MGLSYIAIGGLIGLALLAGWIGLYSARRGLLFFGAGMLSYTFVYGLQNIWQLMSGQQAPIGYVAGVMLCLTMLGVWLSKTEEARTRELAKHRSQHPVEHQPVHMQELPNRAA